MLLNIDISEDAKKRTDQLLDDFNALVDEWPMGFEPMENAAAHIYIFAKIAELQLSIEKLNNNMQGIILNGDIG